MHVSARGLGKQFFDQKQVNLALQDINFDIPFGQFCSIVGPSGCGKTSLLRIIGGLDESSQGSVSVAPKESKSVRFGMIFQQSDLFPWMSLRRNIEFLLENNPDVKKDSIKDISIDYLNKVGLEEFADYFPHEVSGGMQQRISIARCFANNADILLMDEPFVFLDYQAKIALHELLLDIWSRSGKTVLFVTHDVEEAVYLSDRILFFDTRPGRLREDISIDFTRPRRIEVLRSDPDYIALINKLTHNIKLEPVV